MADLALIVEYVFEYMAQIFNLYTGSVVLGGVLALWLLRKVYKVFRHL